MSFDPEVLSKHQCRDCHKVKEAIHFSFAVDNEWQCANSGTFTVIGDGTRVAERFPLYAEKAKWELVDSGFVRFKACDPPLPKGSTFGCSEPEKAWDFKCPVGTIGIFPDDAARQTMFKGKFGDVYCILGMGQIQ